MDKSGVCVLVQCDGGNSQDERITIYRDLLGDSITVLGYLRKNFDTHLSDMDMVDFTEDIFIAKCNLAKWREVYKNNFWKMFFAQPDLFKIMDAFDSILDNTDLSMGVMVYFYFRG